MSEHDTTRIAVKILIAKHNHRELKLMALQCAYEYMKAYVDATTNELSTEGA